MNISIERFFRFLKVQKMLYNFTYKNIFHTSTFLDYIHSTFLINKAQFE